MYEECDSNMRLKGTLFLVDFPNGSWIMDHGSWTKSSSVSLKE